MSELRLYALMEHEDDPKKCTAAKLLRQGEIREAERISMIPHGALVLNPEAEKSLSKEDRPEADRFGILVLDCSWELLARFPKLRPGLRHRALPFLIAANPTNFGKAQKLSSAEALAASVYILGERDQAERLMSRFKWGPTFIDINRERLEAYSSVATSAEVVRIQNEMLRTLDVSQKDVQ